MKKRYYNNGDGEFILEPLSDSLIKVTHRDQVGYIGITKNWDAAKPYTWTFMRGTAGPGGVDIELTVKPDGIDGNPYAYSTLEEPFNMLCGVLPDLQRKEDSKRINPEGRRDAARQVLGEFLETLPD